MSGFVERSLQALRLLMRHKRFAALAIISLAVGIALNTTMYGTIDTIIAPKLLIPDHENLYTFQFFGNRFRKIAPQEIEDAMANVSFAQATTGWQWLSFDSPIEGGGNVAEATAIVIKPNYFKVLGVKASHGRLIGEADMTDNARPVVVSEQLWKQLFPSHKSFVPAVISLAGDPRLMVGTLPPQADFPGSNTGIWALPTPEGASLIRTGLVRLKPGMKGETLGAELETLRLRFAERTGEWNAGESGFRFWRATVRPFRVNQFHYALIGSVVAVLLVACANLANLQLARGVSRARELATRAAVGASRGDIITQLMVESAWLAFGGLLLAAVFTLWGVHLIDANLPPRVFEYIARPQISWRVALFAIGATVFCLVLVGLAPAWKLSRVDVNDLLKSGAGTGNTRSARRQYGVLVAVEVALALAVLCSAALLARAALDVLMFDGGLQDGGVVQTRVFVRPESPTDLRTRTEWSTELIQRALQVEGVTNASVVTSGSPTRRVIAVYGADGAPIHIKTAFWGYRIVTPEYLRTMRIPIVKGRNFSENEFAQPNVIVDQHTAAFLWPGQEPIGKQIKLDSAHWKSPWLTVIGVAKPYDPYFQREEYARTNKKPHLGAVYVLNALDTARVLPPSRGSRYSTSFQLVVRGAGDPAKLAPLVFRGLTDLGANSRVMYPLTWEQYSGVGRLRVQHSFMASLFLVFGGLALGLAAMGVYAIVAHMVAQRTREFGVRIAVGAGARDIRQIVVREGNILTLLGIAIGLLITAKNAAFVREFVFSDDDRWDSRVFAVVAAFIFAVAWMASYLPARRAMRINPVEALRND